MVSNLVCSSYHFLTDHCSLVPADLGMTISALLSNCLLALTSSIESLIACWLVLLITPLVAYLVYRSLLSLTRWLAFAKTDDDDDDDSDSDSGEHSTCCNKMIRLLSSKGKSGSQEGGAAGTPTSPTASTETNTGSSVGGGGAKITSKQTTTHFEGKGSKCNGKVMDFNYGDIDFDCQASVDVSRVYPAETPESHSILVHPQLHTMERLPKYYIEHGHFMTHLHDDARSLIEAFERGHRINPQGNCLGRIDLAEKKVIYSNYATVYERIKNFGNGLYSLLNGTRQSQQQLLPQTVAIYSGNCSEFIVAEYGCYYHSFVVVPVYDTLGPNICSFIVNQGKGSEHHHFRQHFIVFVPSPKPRSSASCAIGWSVCRWCSPRRIHTDRFDTSSSSMIFPRVIKSRVRHFADC